MRMLSKTLILFVLGSLFWGMANAATPDTGGVVLVGTARDLSRERLRVGFITDDRGHLIASVNAPDKKLYVTLPGGVIYEADTLAQDPVTGLSLLKISSDIEVLQPYPFALEPPQLQRQMSAVKVQGDLAQSRMLTGTLSRVQQADADGPDYYLLAMADALVDKTDAGSPLLNNCGEVMGVIVAPPGRSWRSWGKKDTYAVVMEWLATQFAAHEITPVRADEVCLSDAEQARRDAEIAAQAAAQAVKEKQAKLDEVQARLDKVQGISEEEQKRLKKELATLESELEEAQKVWKAEQKRLQSALDEAEAERQRLLDAQKVWEATEQQYMTWGIAVAGTLLLLLLLVWLLKQRTVNRERREKAAVKSSAAAAQASLATLEEDEARIRQTPTVFFEGTDSTGKAVALRVPGASIAASDGAVVGRNPAHSDFIINHPEVSRRQFRLFTDEGVLMIEDLGSTNGTTVDGKPLGGGEKAILTDRCRVELSDLKLSVRLEQG